jgi:hypothetical protein
MVNIKTVLTIRKEQEQEKYLALLATCGVEAEACELAEITQSQLYLWRKRDRKAVKEERAKADDPTLFTNLENEARQKAHGKFVSEAVKRALEGWHEPVIHQGRMQYVRDPVTGIVKLDDQGHPIPLMVHKKSERLLEVLLKAYGGPEFNGGSGMKTLQVTTASKGPGASSDEPWTTVLEVKFIDSDGEGGRSPLDS